jgi:DNA polymerase III epsilon subunit-like protein
MKSHNFLVLDTEGKNILREIAIINHQDQVIYEAFVQEKYSQQQKLKSKLLTEIIEDLSSLLHQKTIICHNAKHDEQILRNSFRQCSLPFPSVQFICTLELARNKYPHFVSHSLDNLSRQLFIKVDNLFFQTVKAHRASYDARYTLQLYLNLISKSQKLSQKTMVVNPAINNPFSSNRVDNPFQNHLDFSHIYNHQFEHLKSLVEEIKNDTTLGKQSKAAVVIGEAGNGKTHLMMRLAKATLKTNRVLYVRQPNNAESVMHHIYARVLESFAQKIDIADTERTQLDLLLAHVFIRILELIQAQDQTQKLTNIIQALQNDSLSLFERLGTEGTQKNVDNWKYIETKVTKWWESNYSSGGYSPNILEGIIKFCRYKDTVTGGINRKDQVRRWLAGIELDEQTIDAIGLTNWREEDLSKEDFALEAIRLFGQLSTLDEPLIIVFDQLESLINRPAILEGFGNALREIITVVPNCLIIVNLFPDRWEHFQYYLDDSVTDRLSANQINLKTPSQEELKAILQLKCQAVNCNLHDIFLPDDLAKILQQTSIRKVINKAADYYRYRVLNIPLPEEISPQKSISLEEKITNLENALSQIVNICSSVMPVNNTLLEVQKNIINNKEFDFSSLEKSPAINSNNGSQSNPQTRIVGDYLAENEQLLTLDYHNPHIITDDDDYGKLVTIMEAFQEYDSSIKIDHLSLGKRKLPAHLLIVKNDRQLVVGFLHLGGSIFTSRIKNWNELALDYPQINFSLLRDEREGDITGKVGRQEIDKLNYLKNGSFMMIDRSNRVIFELIYKMIVDINQGDLEVSKKDAIAVLREKYNSYWLIEKLQ